MLDASCLIVSRTPTQMSLCFDYQEYIKIFRSMLSIHLGLEGILEVCANRLGFVRYKAVSSILQVKFVLGNNITLRK